MLIIQYEKGKNLKNKQLNICLNCLEIYHPQWFNGQVERDTMTESHINSINRLPQFWSIFWKCRYSLLLSETTSPSYGNPALSFTFHSLPLHLTAYNLSSSIKCYKYWHNLINDSAQFILFLLQPVLVRTHTFSCSFTFIYNSLQLNTLLFCNPFLRNYFNGYLLTFVNL